MPARNPLIVALDTAEPERAASWAVSLASYAGMFKLGLEFFLAHGPGGVTKVSGAPVFLDLKLHDIPNTVAGAVRAVLPLQPRMLTVHASGGSAMMRAAAQAASAAGMDRPTILAVTVLTSLDAAALNEVGVSATPAEQVLHLGALAVQAGVDGLVCSPHEVAILREALGPEVKLVVPGIRPKGAAPGDQARTMTPAEAIQAGADWIVVGRPITGAGDPATAATAILETLP